MRKNLVKNLLATALIPLSQSTSVIACDSDALAESMAGPLSIREERVSKETLRHGLLQQVSSLVPILEANIDFSQTYIDCLKEISPATLETLNIEISIFLEQFAPRYRQNKYEPFKKQHLHLTNAYEVLAFDVIANMYLLKALKQIFNFMDEPKVPTTVMQKSVKILLEELVELNQKTINEIYQLCLDSAGEEYAILIKRLDNGSTALIAPLNHRNDPPLSELIKELGILSAASSRSKAYDVACKLIPKWFKNKGQFTSMYSQLEIGLLYNNLEGILANLYQHLASINGTFDEISYQSKTDIASIIVSTPSRDKFTNQIIGFVSKKLIPYTEDLEALTKIQIAKQATASSMVPKGRMAKPRATTKSVRERLLEKNIQKFESQASFESCFVTMTEIEHFVNNHIQSSPIGKYLKSLNTKALPLKPLKSPLDIYQKRESKPLKTFQVKPTVIPPASGANVQVASRDELQESAPKTAVESPEQEIVQSGVPTASDSTNIADPEGEPTLEEKFGVPESKANARVQETAQGMLPAASASINTADPEGEPTLEEKFGLPESEADSPVSDFVKETEAGADAVDWSRPQDFPKKDKVSIPVESASLAPAAFNPWQKLQGQALKFYKAVFGLGAHNVKREDFNDFLRQAKGGKLKQTAQGLKEVPITDASVLCVYRLPDLFNPGNNKIFKVHQPHGNESFPYRTLRRFFEHHLIAAGYAPPSLKIDIQKVSDNKQSLPSKNKGRKKGKKG
ncbi:hypothetical protein [Candidatus Odyssella thessalonicensis]|uniref:hypothetical protein n=1 Tax=Candidatus Odyssella thessalonicensis TaxID=84647 RepID=UPI000225B1EA|nr:hypothetical protein [Candidatus Odyssella thessalonicensis]